MPPVSKSIHNSTKALADFPALESGRISKTTWAYQDSARHYGKRNDNVTGSLALLWSSYPLGIVSLQGSQRNAIAREIDTIPGACACLSLRVKEPNRDIHLTSATAA